MKTLSHCHQVIAKNVCGITSSIKRNKTILKSTSFFETFGSYFLFTIITQHANFAGISPTNQFIFFQDCLLEESRKCL